MGFELFFFFWYRVGNAVSGIPMPSSRSSVDFVYITSFYLIPIFQMDNQFYSTVTLYIVHCCNIDVIGNTKMLRCYGDYSLQVY